MHFLLACLSSCALAASALYNNPNGVVALPVQAVELPGRITRGSERSVVPLDCLWSGVVYAINLTIGSNKQPVTVQLDTGSDDLWVNPICSNYPNRKQRAYCQRAPRYNPATSKTSVRLDVPPEVITYHTGKLLGDFYTDDIKIGESTVKAQQFVVARRDILHALGVLGVGPRNFGARYSPLIESMVEQDQINSQVFSLDLRSKDQQGSILFGGIDTKKYKCMLGRLKFAEPITITGYQSTGKRNYYAYLKGVGASIAQTETKVDLSKNSEGLSVILDSGASSTWLPTEIFEAVGSRFPGAVLYTTMTSPVYVVPCKPPPGTMDFHFENATIKVPWKELMIYDDSIRQCILGVMPSDHPMGPKQPVLGDTFLRAAYVVFDLGNDEVWLGQADDCGSDIVPVGKGLDAVPVVEGCSCER